MSSVLSRLSRPLSQPEVADLVETGAVPAGTVENVLRRGAPLSDAPLNDLMSHLRRDVDAGRWTDEHPELSDSWLAPRVHSALRLTRAEASDRGTWHWLAVGRHSWYVEFRWTGKEGVNDARWLGPIHKQALARLWWGAELFRNGPDYAPVQALFARQDLPNSYLHRGVHTMPSTCAGPS